MLTALEGLDADVVGLVERENSIAEEPAADLVAGLDALEGAGSWAYVDTGVIGNDAVRANGGQSCLLPGSVSSKL